MSRAEKIRLVEAYLKSLLHRDTEGMSFAEDVTFEGPTMPKLEGRQTVLGFMKKIMFPAVKNIEVRRHIVEGDYVATVFAMETTLGVEHVCDVIHVRNGQIRGINAFFYPQQRSGG